MNVKKKTHKAKLDVEIDYNLLSQRDQETLQKLLQKAKPFRCEDFDIKPNDEYYYVGSKGTPIKRRYLCSEFDNQLLAFGNVSKSEAYMKKRAKEIKLYNLLSDYAWKLYGGVAFEQALWNDCTINKFIIGYDTEAQTFRVVTKFLYFHPLEVYFRSKVDAQNAIEKIVLPFMWEEYPKESITVGGIPCI